MSKMEPVANAEVVEFFPVDASGELKSTAEIAVYESAPQSADKRAVFMVGFWSPSLTFVRWEYRNRPEDNGSPDQEWSGRKTFGQSAPDKAVKAEAKRLFDSLVAMPGAERLALAVNVAEVQADAATAWAESRIRHLAARPAEETKRRSSSLTSAIYGIEQHESRMREAFYRVNALKRATDLLGFTSRASEI
jgi:hypothetical protein